MPLLKQNQNVKQIQNLTLSPVFFIWKPTYFCFYRTLKKKQNTITEMEKSNKIRRDASFSISPITFFHLIKYMIMLITDIKIIFEGLCRLSVSILSVNKPAIYHQHSLRLPVSVKMPSERLKRFNFSKYSFFTIFSTFSKWFFFHFSPKKPRIKVRKTSFLIKKYVSTDRHSAAQIPTPFCDFGKIHFFVKETHLLFREKTKSLNILRKLKLSVAFYGQFATIWWLKIFNFKNVGHRTFSIGKIRKTNVGSDRFEWKIFIPSIL